MGNNTTKLNSLGQKTPSIFPAKTHHTIPRFCAQSLINSWTKDSTRTKDGAPAVDDSISASCCSMGCNFSLISFTALRKDEATKHVRELMMLCLRLIIDEWWLIVVDGYWRLMITLGWWLMVAVDGYCMTIDGWWLMDKDAWWLDNLNEWCWVSQTV